jgi:hypothetical protein
VSEERTSHPVWVGIDPGLEGAIVILNEKGHIISAKPMPTITITKGKSRKRQYDPEAIIAILKDRTLDQWVFDDIACVVIEKTQAMPGQGVASMHSTGLGGGLIWGLVVGLGLKYLRVHPKQWQSAMLKWENGSDPKGRALTRAQSLFGRDKLIPDRCRVPHDGIVDAALMAEYGRLECSL